MNSGIYQIINIINSKIYIGSAKWFDHRWRVHKYNLHLNKHGSKHLQRAWNKYGEENFEFQKLEIVSNLNILLEREQFWLDRINPYLPEIGYNILQIAGSRLGSTHTEEFKKLRSWAYKGNKLTQESIEKIRLANTGQKRTDDQRKRMSEAQKNNVHLRKIDKWPHGYSCKCETCVILHRENKRKYRKIKESNNE